MPLVNVSSHADLLHVKRCCLAGGRHMPVHFFLNGRAGTGAFSSKRGRGVFFIAGGNRGAFFQAGRVSGFPTLSQRSA